MRPDVLNARDYHEEPRQLCGVTGHCTPLRGPVEARLGVGGSEEVLPVYVAEMEDPCLLGIDYLMQVGACIDLKKRKLRIREKEVLLSLGVAPAEVVMAECVRIASDTEPKVNFELSGKLENHDSMTESIEPLEQADDSEEVTFQKRLPGNEGVVNDVSLPDHLTDLARRSAIHLDHQQQERLRSTLTRYADVFSKGDLDLGRTGLVQHHIRTGDILPIKHAPRRIAPARREEMQRSVMEMEAQGVVERSDSPWSSPVVLVTKKDGTKRFCVDYRSLNNGLWQFTVMPFGLCNAPSCFERLMERVLEGLQWRTALVYLDDIIVFGGSFDEELERLEVVLRRLRTANLKLSPKQCLFFQSEVPFLGNIVGRDGVKTDPQKVAAVQDWPVPTCVADVKSFVGLCTYYRRFVKQFAQIAYPLHQLTRKGARFEWSAACQKAFDSLKRALVEAPVLPYPDPASPYLLDTDASAEGLGAVLSQWMEASPERPGWPQVTAESPVTKHLWQQWAMLRLENGVLQRRWDDVRGRPSYWVVLVPRTLRRDLLHELHGGITSSHLGVKRTD
ncbi:hypothetical protein C7M84_016626 [Penaeus vannamei]|uniref:RNA-directed DNA polymerase n=1 Tax=Penaeus vannamei TaxID=6689 RepID=A0A423SMH9_PENVA|nr:hypothetical protein C7M84_016626 [Penaeus vannamei]